jgi:RHS repeat-associated protein
VLLNYGGHSWILESELHITTYFLATCTNVPIAGSLRCDRSTVNKVVRANDDLNQLTDFARGVLSDSNSDGILDTVTSPSRTQAWDLDAMGNWQSLSTNGAGQSRTHNAQNQVTGVGSASLTFDANGSMTTDETGNTFVYDAWNRLVEAVDGSSVTQAEYAYDALGRRIVETRPVASTTDHLYHSTGWQVLEERRGGTASGDVRHQYLWSIDYVDAMVARVDYASGTVTAKYNVAYDANWNVTAIFDHNNLGAAIRERYEYDPYGAVTILAPNGTVRSSSSYDWKYLHQTGRLDGDTGLYHFRNRDYSATLGRWTQTDPIGFEAGDTNLYRYVGNGPVNAVDPWGLEWWDPRSWDLTYYWRKRPSLDEIRQASEVVIRSGGHFGYAWESRYGESYTEAIAFSRECYPFPNRQMSNKEYSEIEFKQNAARHGYWQARLVQWKIVDGRRVAKIIGDAHERGTNQPIIDSWIDQYNNEIARKIGMSCAISAFAEQKDPVTVLKERIRIALINEELIIRSDDPRIPPSVRDHTGGRNAIDSGSFDPRPH